ncbi:hypothetical protein ABW21_db0207645 [Orbilia brochopaga]|nr:hypothetical protein ABW21_db0207645 [Drechslerella brochopaga]
MAPVSYSYDIKTSQSTTTSEGTASRSTHITPSGTTVTERSQPAGGQPSTTTSHFPADNSGVTITAEEAERRYLEAMEDEYAKREGGA